MCSLHFQVMASDIEFRGLSVIFVNTLISQSPPPDLDTIEMTLG